MCVPDPHAPVREKIRYSIHENSWYGPVLIYTAVMATICVVLLITGVRVG